MEAQRYPDDYDGIIAGDPANNWTRFYAGGHLWYWLATAKDPEQLHPREQVPLLTDAVNAACDALDRVQDGVLEDPRTCTFDPSTLACRDRPGSGDVLHPRPGPGSPATSGTARSRPQESSCTRARAGRRVRPGGWAAWMTGSAPSTGTHTLAADGVLQEHGVRRSEVGLPHLQLRHGSAPRAREGWAAPGRGRIPTCGRCSAAARKLLVYHGWSDPRSRR